MDWINQENGDIRIAGMLVMVMKNSHHDDDDEIMMIKVIIVLMMIDKIRTSFMMMSVFICELCVVKYYYISGTNILFPSGTIDPWHALGTYTKIILFDMLYFFSDILCLFE